MDLARGLGAWSGPFSAYHNFGILDHFRTSPSTGVGINKRHLRNIILPPHRYNTI